MANTGSHPNPLQEVQDEFWVLRQLLNSNDALNGDVRQHLDRMRHRIVGVVRSLLKENNALESEINALEKEIDDLENELDGVQ